MRTVPCRRRQACDLATSAEYLPHGGVEWVARRNRVAELRELVAIHALCNRDS